VKEDRLLQFQFVPSAIKQIIALNTRGTKDHLRGFEPGQRGVLCSRKSHSEVFDIGNRCSREFESDAVNVVTIL
jgi:hypothetical protein